MSALEQIQQEAARRELQFLVIGGYAVIVHGYTRTTEDLDLLVRREDQARWRELLSSLAYQLTHDGGNFLQFARTEGLDWPVDLMLVGQSTFDGLIAEARLINLQGAQVQIVSLEHLIALKLHVLKQARLHRFLKDFQDVLELIQINHLDLQSPRIRDLFLRYGNSDLYAKFQRALSHD